MQTMQNNSAILKYFPFITTLLCMIKQINLVSMIPYTNMNKKLAFQSAWLTYQSFLYHSFAFNWLYSLHGKDNFFTQLNFHDNKSIIEWRCSWTGFPVISSSCQCLAGSNVKVFAWALTPFLTITLNYRHRA